MINTDAHSFEVVRGMQVFRAPGSGEGNQMKRITQFGRPWNDFLLLSRSSGRRRKSLTARFHDFTNWQRIHSGLKALTMYLAMVILSIAQH